MKQVWLSLFFAATFAIACSSAETTENNTEESTMSSTQDASNENENGAVAVATNLEGAPATNLAEVDNSLSNPEGTSNTGATAATNNTNAVVTTTETGATNAKPVVEAATIGSTSPKNEVVESKTTSTSSQPVTTTKAAPKPAAKPAAKVALSHDIFDGLLRKHVNSTGDVNYGAFKKDKAKLVEYLEVLKGNPPQSSWSKNKEMAYWINLYNAFTIHSIVEKYPINSVMNLEDGKLWDKKKIVIGGKSLTLNNIEKDKLLKRFKEPRVHFAVNCGAISCPPLLNKAWTEDNIQRYYDKQAKAFINNPKHNTISIKNLEASQIFNWYASDFGGSDKVLSYFQKYSDTEIKKNAKVSFKEYNWKLNKQ
jgi:hypothetical protein